MLKLDKYHILVLIYFFVNSLFLPAGLLYTMILTPLFYFWSVKQGAHKIITYFIICWLPFTLFHVLNGANLYYYTKSSIMLFTVYVFSYTFHLFLKKKKIQTYFPLILKINFILFLIAVALYFTPWIEVLWTVRNLTIEIKDFPRLEMLTYEPSYYSFLLAPIAIYYTLKLVLLSTTWIKTITYTCTIYLPLLFSFSLGIISSTVIAFILFFLLNIKTLYPKKKLFYSITSITILIVLGLLLLLVIYPDNPLYERLGDLVEGKDISAKGRTYNAFQIAHEIVEEKSLLFGVGLGQIKVVGSEIIRKFYHYNIHDLASIRIPNSLAETFAMFGIIGLILRFGIQFFLFFKTKVFTNYYRTVVFLFVFIYQFTGSFFTNTVELVMWVIAFTPCCSIFDRKNFQSKRFKSDINFPKE